MWDVSRKLKILLEIIAMLTSKDICMSLHMTIGVLASGAYTYFGGD